MLSFLSYHSHSKHPIILIPGLMGSILNGDINSKPYWFCSKQKNQNVWFNDKYAIPPTYKCLFDYIKLEWDSASERPKQPDYVNIHTVDFGGIGGINHVDTVISGVHIVPYYSVMIKKLKAAGFVVGQDIYGAPFDWRFGVYQTDEFWKSLTDLVESIFSKTGKKVVIAGHSMGGFLLQRLLSNITTPEWRKKYIEGGIYLAPSFGGSGLGFSSLYSQKWPALGILGKFPESVSSLGGIHVHMLNHEIYGDRVVVVGKKGEKLTAKNLTNYLIENGKLYGDYYRIFQKNEPFFQEAPISPDVPSLVIYNSGLPTEIGADLSGKTEKSLYGKGDLMVNEEGPKWACDHWTDTQCYDMKSINPIDNHLMLIYTDRVINKVIDFLNRP